MKVYIYSFYDKVSKSWLPPVSDTAPIENVVETYQRQIPSIIKDEKALQQVKDKNLYCLGVMDDNTGNIVLADKATPLIDFDNLILNSISEVSHDEN